MTRLKKSKALLASALLAAILLTSCQPTSVTLAEQSGVKREVGRRTKSSNNTSTTSTTSTSTTIASTTSSTTEATTTTTVAPTTTTTTTPPSTTGFVHPGVLVSRADLDFVKAKIAAGQEPWTSALNKVLTSGSSSATSRRPSTYRYSSLSYPPAPVTAVQAAGSSNTAYINAHPELGFQNVGGVEHLDDARAAYTHALLWYYTGNQSYANKAIQIMNAWSSTLTQIKFADPVRPDTGGPLYDNGKLQAGWGASLFARAAEIIRYSNAGWAGADVARFESMLDDVYLPLTITGWSNGANWLMTFSEATISIGVFTNDRATFDAGVAYWRQKAPTTIYLPSDGSWPVPPTSWYNTLDRIKSYWYQPSTFVSGLQGETLRDLSHMTMGLGAMSNAAQTAGIQGVNLFGEQQARIVAGYERSAAYVNDYLDEVARLGGASPASSWRPSGWPGSSFSLGGTGYKSGWEVAYQHYAALGVSMPETARLVARLRPTGAALHMSWETLSHAR